MTRKPLFVVAMLAFAVAISVSSQPASAQQPSAPGKFGIERMYVLYCGDIALNDASSFTPGASGSGALTVSCYLIKHRDGWLLWDTGIPDAIASMPNGQKSGAGNWTTPNTLVSQIVELRLNPSHLTYLALSHSHGDHVGNVDAVAQATLVAQKAEYDWPPPDGKPRFSPAHEA